MKERLKNLFIFIERLFRKKDFRRSLLVFIFVVASVVGTLDVGSLANEILRLSDYQINEISCAVQDLYYGDPSEDAKEALMPLYDKYGDDISIEFKSPTLVSAEVSSYMTDVKIDFTNKENPIVSHSQDYGSLVYCTVLTVLIAYDLPLLVIYIIGRLITRWYKNHIAAELESFKLEQHIQRTVEEAKSLEDCNKSDDKK